eukprot:987379-Amphidinium_carterae.1
MLGCEEAEDPHESNPTEWYHLYSHSYRHKALSPLTENNPIAVTSLHFASPTRGTRLQRLANVAFRPIPHAVREGPHAKPAFSNPELSETCGCETRAPTDMAATLATSANAVEG